MWYSQAAERDALKGNRTRVWCEEGTRKERARAWCGGSVALTRQNEGKVRARVDALGRACSLPHSQALWGSHRKCSVDVEFMTDEINVGESG